MVMTEGRSCALDAVFLLLLLLDVTLQAKWHVEMKLVTPSERCRYEFSD